MWVLAKGYGWDPEKVEEMNIEKMYFWLEGLNWLKEHNG